MGLRRANPESCFDELSGMSSRRRRGVSLVMAETRKVVGRRLVAGLIGFAAVMTGILGGCTPHARYTSPSHKAPKAERAPRRRTNAVRAKVADTASDSRSADTIPNDLEKVVASYIGIPYRYGGTTRRGMDCSGFVRRVFIEVYGTELPRTSREIARMGRPVRRRRALPGDIVVFRRGGVGRVNHVGIYLGADNFVHASRRAGVTRSSLDDEYHARRFSCIRRVGRDPR
ncbi:MAG: bifunctional murein DD-endopeptidase/murein LD-carboxypeptidase [Chitinivibrionales bacterium]|nr:bifunctional murein DD-endopeptidase/murein LD-carboxypeptidase [Chitinivibrionales bacterium]MBD3356750.1 bifunctional murein DD-endopeptidase/murein LD-carboxypeptidase [Chitinivibrionales bacterium]